MSFNTVIVFYSITSQLVCCCGWYVYPHYFRFSCFGRGYEV